MKKLVCFLLIACLAFTCFAACGETNKGAEVVMITDIGDIDDQSFNQGTWDGVKAWCEKNNKTYEYLKPVSSNEADLISAVDLAVSNGAKTIVCPGFVFATAIWKAQETYPNVKFVVLDSGLNNADYSDFTVKSNVACFTYEAEYSGFLAGYAAVKEGMTKLAYLGGIGYGTVYCFGAGFVQGAELAATEMGIANVSVQYGYTGNFDETAANKAKAASIFASGVECLISVGGKNQKSCFQAASEASGNVWVISPDTDSTGLSNKCLTSALKELAATVAVALDDLYNNNGANYFGKSTVLTISDGMVGLCDNFSRFTKFTKADYDAIYAKLVSGEVKVVMPSSDFSKATGTPSEITLSHVTIEYID